MRRTFLYLLSLFMVGISLPSCLDDTGANITGTNYSVIVQTEDVPEPYAFVGAGLTMTWSGLSTEYYPGDVILLHYDVDPYNQNAWGLIEVETGKHEVIESYPNQYQKRIAIGEGVADTSAIANEYKFEALNINNQLVTDRWIFTTRVKLKDGQTIDPEFFYDTKEGMQHSSTGGKLPDNGIVIDVKLNIKGSGDGTEKSQDKIFVADFSQLRSELFRNVTDPGTHIVPVWLRYYTNNNQDKPTYVQTSAKFAHYVDTTTKQ